VESRVSRKATAWCNAVLAGLTLMWASLAWAAAPNVNNVTSSTANGTYGTGSAISIQVVFDQSVTVTGTPKLALNSGGTANYSSGSGSPTLTFSYTVAASDGAEDLDYTSTSALTLNGGTIANSGNVNAVLTLPAPGATNSLGANKAIVIKTPPLLPAANIAVDNVARPNTIKLTFNESLDDFEARQASNYTVKNNDGSITYTIEYAIPTAPDTVLLYLAPADPNDNKTYITNQDIARHIKVTPSAFLADQQGYTWTGGTVTEAGGTHTRDLTAPTVNATASASSNTSIEINFSEVVAKALASNKVNYTLSGTAGFTGNPSAVTVDASGTKATLTVPSMANLADGKTVIVTVAAAVTDLAGNPVSPSARTATLTIGRKPGAFAFTTVENAAPGALVESNAVTISGVTVPTALTVAEGANSSLKCARKPPGGEWLAFVDCSTLMVVAGDEIKLQLKASDKAETPTVSATIALAGMSSTFTVKTATSVIVPEAVKLTTLKAVSEVLRSPPKAVYVSLNGVLVVPAGVSAPLDIAQSAPNDAGIYLPAGANANFLVNGQGRTIEANGGDALLVLKSFTVDGYPKLQTLELASGRIRLSGGSGQTPVLSVLVGTSTAKQIVLMPVAGSATPSADVRRQIDGSVQVAVRAGRIHLRWASAASTVALADKPTLLYAREVANIAADGKLSSIRVGSLERNEGFVGDPMSDFPVAGSAAPIIDARIPRLSVPHERVDATKNLMWALLDTIGPRATMTQAFQNSWGQVLLRVDNVPLYLTPIGDVVVDTTLPDGVTLNANGRFELVRAGVKTTFVPSVIDLGHFTAAMQRTYRGYVLMHEDGALEISENGNTLIMQPDLFVKPVSGVRDGISVGSDALIRYTYGGQQQILYPRLYDMSQLARTFGNANTQVTLRANLDGTVTATMKSKATEAVQSSETTLLLIPAYNVLSPIGGIPPEHRNDPWWLDDDGLIYIKYDNGSAQGFALR